jgi:hypothetical protein
MCRFWVFEFAWFSDETKYTAMQGSRRGSERIRHREEGTKSDEQNSAAFSPATEANRFKKKQAAMTEAGSDGLIVKHAATAVSKIHRLSTPPAVKMLHFMGKEVCDSERARGAVALSVAPLGDMGKISVAAAAAQGEEVCDSERAGGAVVRSAAAEEVLPAFHPLSHWPSTLSPTGRGQVWYENANPNMYWER